MVERERISKGGAKGRIVVHAAVLMIAWMLLSGHFDLFHLLAGAAGVASLLWLDRKLGSAALEDAGYALHPRWGRIFLYVPWLMWQMVLSAWHVGKVIWRPSVYPHIRPELVSFRSAQPHAVARVVLANSITLTPGTLTLVLEGDKYLVHALTKETADGVLDGSMQRKVGALFAAELKEDAATNGKIVVGRRAK